MPLRRSDRRHARARLLDSRQRDAAPSGRGGEGRAREERALPVQAGTGGARALRRQRTDAVAARAPGRRERAARRAHRLLPREGRRRCGAARDSRCEREGGADLLEHRTGLRSGSGQGHGRLRRGVQEDADGRLLRPPALLARAAVHRLAEGGDAPLQLGSQVRSRVARRSGARRRRGSDGRGARPHLSELQRAVGAAGELHRAAHGRRRDEDAADRGQARSARADRAGGARDTEHAEHRAVLGGGRRAPGVQRGARAGRDTRRAIRRRGGCDQGRAGSARSDWTPAQRAPAPPPRRRTGDAVAGSGEQRAAGRGDGHAGGRGRADGGATGGGQPRPARRHGRSWRNGRR